MKISPVIGFVFASIVQTGALILHLQWNVSTPLFTYTIFTLWDYYFFKFPLYICQNSFSPLNINFFYFLASWNLKKKIVYLKGVKAAHLNSTRKKFHVSPRLKYSRAKKSRQMNMQPVWENLKRSIICS